MPAPDPITKTPPADPAKKPDANGDGAAPPAKPVRPEKLGDSLNGYWSDDNGVDFGKLSTDFQTLSTFKAEADSRAAQVPGKVEEYEVALPEGWKAPDGAPADFKFEVAADNPIVPLAREFAQKHGLTKDGFRDLVALQAHAQVAEHKALATAAAAEKGKLGTKADERVNAVTAWATSVLGNEHANALLPMMFSAKQVEAFEKIMAVAKAGGPKLSAVGREGNAAPTEPTDEEWERMSPTQRIMHGRTDPMKRKAS